MAARPARLAAVSGVVGRMPAAGHRPDACG